MLLSEWNNLYPGYRLYNPSTRKNGRKVVTMYNPATKHHTSINYAKYLVEIHLSRRLRDDEEVHHKDGNLTNDVLDNLEVMNSLDHTRLHPPLRDPMKMTVRKCEYCRHDFEIQESRVKYKLKTNKTGKIYCSQDCANVDT